MDKIEKWSVIGIVSGKLLMYFCLGAAAFLMGLGLGYQKGCNVYRGKTTLEINMNSVAVDSTVVYKMK